MDIQVPDDISELDGWVEACPRCLGPLRAFVHDSGAGSRSTMDRDIAICGKCGSDEAVRQCQTGEIIPASEWPVLNGAHDYRPEWA